MPAFAPAGPLRVDLQGATSPNGTVLTGATSGTGQAVLVAGYQNLVLYLTSSGTTSGGVVTIEEASDIGYGGTWSSVTTVNASSFSGGATVAYHFPVSAYGAIRARISSAITGGGSIAVVLRAN